MAFKILFFCPRWGASDSWDSFCHRVKAAGYDGVESHLSMDAGERAEEVAALKNHQLLFIGQYWQSIEDDATTMAMSMTNHFHNLLHADPLFINSQTGRDYFSMEENKVLLDKSAEFTAATGIKVLHETHRGKLTFAAHITRAYLEQFPEMRLTLDISHWCNVHESLLENQQDAVKTAIEHTDHIHSRIGYTQGPQVNDPRAPEWQDVLQSHLSWWDKVVEIKKKGDQLLTITTEFGPFPYMPSMPYTNKPIADQWEVNLYMKRLLKDRYSVS
jgi:hypothetical protein